MHDHRTSHGAAPGVRIARRTRDSLLRYNTGSTIHDDPVTCRPQGMHVLTLP
jgi:hypothetical protein